MFDPKRPRDKAALDNFKQLFKANANEFKSNDPELMEILQKYIFGDIFSIGDLTIKEREMITVVCLASIQCLPQSFRTPRGSLYLLQFLRFSKNFKCFRYF